MQNIQTVKLGKDVGSTSNYMLGNNATAPVVGKGATVLLWSDRQAYEVVEVSENQQTVKIKRCLVKALKNNTYTEDQEWDYSKLSDHTQTLVYENGKWCEKHIEIIFKPSYYKEYEKLGNEIGFFEARKQMVDILFVKGELQLIKGKTKIRNKSNPINIVFGYQNEYNDPTF
jgi:hypothetical protein